MVNNIISTTTINVLPKFNSIKQSRLTETIRANEMLKNHIIIVQDQQKKLHSNNNFHKIKRDYSKKISYEGNENKDTNDEDINGNEWDDDVVNILNNSNNGFFSISMSIQPEALPYPLKKIDTNSKIFEIKIEEIKEEPEKENFQDSIKKNKKENNVVRSLDKKY